MLFTFVGIIRSRRVISLACGQVVLLDSQLALAFNLPGLAFGPALNGFCRFKKVAVRHALDDSTRLGAHVHEHYVGQLIRASCSPVDKAELAVSTFLCQGVGAVGDRWVLNKNCMLLRRCALFARVLLIFNLYGLLLQLVQ